MLILALGLDMRSSTGGLRALSVLVELLSVVPPEDLFPGATLMEIRVLPMAVTLLPLEDSFLEETLMDNLVPLMVEVLPLPMAVETPMVPLPVVETLMVLPPLTEAEAGLPRPKCFLIVQQRL